MNRDNQPTYNVNRNIANFGDFTSNIDDEKEELMKVKRSTTPNSERQQLIGNKKYKFNKVTRKIDDLSQDEIIDDIDAIEELQEELNYTWLGIGIVTGFLTIGLYFSNPSNKNISNNSNIKIEFLTKDSNLFQSVQNAIKDNQIQKARNLVSTSNESNILFDAIRNNEIQKARDINDYLSLKQISK